MRPAGGPAGRAMMAVGRAQGNRLEGRQRADNFLKFSKKEQQFPKIFVASGGATGLTTKSNFSQVVYLTVDALITSTP